MLRNFHIVKILVLLIVTLQLIFITSCGIEKNELLNSKPQNIGNTMGNLMNLGFVTNNNDSIFYMAFNDPKVSLNRKNIKGDNEIISYGLCLYLNVLDEFIYYINDKDEIYKMDINGNQKTKLSNIKAAFLCVFNDTIYALGGDSDKYDKNLYSMNIDGSDFKILSNEKIGKLYIYNDKIYYNTFIDGETYLYKMNLAGKDKELIIKSTGMEDLFYIYKDNLYYLSSGGVFSINKFNISNKEYSLVNKTDGQIPNGLINGNNNFIFFKSTSPRTYYLLNLDTGELNSSIDDRFNNNVTVNGIQYRTGLYSVGNKVFFYENGQLNYMNIDGSNVEPFN